MIYAHLELTSSFSYYPPALLLNQRCLVVDFDVQRCSRVCAITQRELGPGDQYYSVLVRDGASVERQDIFSEAWSGPPGECIAWWRSVVPDPQHAKLHWAPHDVMLHYFAETDDDAAKADVRYILALLMIRRRIFRLEETEIHESGVEEMILFCPRTETEHRVEVTPLNAERADEIQALLADLLVDTGGQSHDA